MRPTLFLLSVIAALVASTMAVQDGLPNHRRNAMPPRTAQAQAVARRQYVHPAGAARRAAAYANTLDKQKRTWWWFHGGYNGHDPTPPPPAPPSHPQTSVTPPRPCKQGKWQTCGPQVSCYNSYTLATYGHNDDDAKCCKAGLTCKTFGKYGQGFCIEEQAYSWCKDSIKEKLLQTQQQIQDFFDWLKKNQH